MGGRYKNEVDEILEDYEPLRIADPELYDAMKETLNEQKELKKEMEREEVCSILATLGGALCYYGSEMNNPYLDKMGFAMACLSGIALLGPKMEEGVEKLKEYVSTGDEKTLESYG